MCDNCKYLTGWRFCNEEDRAVPRCTKDRGEWKLDEDYEWYCIYYEEIEGTVLSNISVQSIV